MAFSLQSKTASNSYSLIFFKISCQFEKLSRTDSFDHCFYLKRSIRLFLASDCFPFAGCFPATSYQIKLREQMQMLKCSLHSRGEKINGERERQKDEDDNQFQDFLFRLKKTNIFCLQRTWNEHGIPTYYCATNLSTTLSYCKWNTKISTSKYHRNYGHITDNYCSRVKTVRN